MNVYYGDELERYKAIADITTDRLREICAAERDGRLVVLPCKVGDTLYDPYPGKIDECKVTAIEIHVVTDGGVFEPKDIGKQVYFTRAEAEAALGGKEQQNV